MNYIGTCKRCGGFRFWLNEAGHCHDCDMKLALERFDQALAEAKNLANPKNPEPPKETEKTI